MDRQTDTSIRLQSWEKEGMNNQRNGVLDRLMDGQTETKTNRQIL